MVFLVKVLRSMVLIGRKWEDCGEWYAHSRMFFVRDENEQKFYNDGSFFLFLQSQVMVQFQIFVYLVIHNKRFLTYILLQFPGK